jgi:hypothetical protein
MLLYRKSILFLSILSLVCINGCNQPSDNAPSTLNISLVDSPGDYEEVNIEIDSVQVKFQDNDWTSLKDFKSGIYNLLDYTAGHELFVTSQQMPSTMLTQIRVMLGGNNSVVVHGTTYKLVTPGGTESGYKIVVNQALDPGKDVQMVIDFDASSSVRESSGIYLLRPVIKAYNKSATGSISGKVFPEDLNISIQVYANGVIASTFAPKGVSDFIVSGLPEGTYQVIFDPGTQSGYQQFTTDSNIIVTKGNTQDIGTINVVPEGN